MLQKAGNKTFQNWKTQIKLFIQQNIKEFLIGLLHLHMFLKVNMNVLDSMYKFLLIVLIRLILV